MSRFNVPSPPERRVLTIDEFYGVDLHNAPNNVDIHRSPNAPNMIRDVPGKVRKRMGYYKTGEFDGQINGVFFMDGIKIVHAGVKLYADNTVVYSDMNDTRGFAVVFDKKLYIFDGKTAIVYGKFDDVYAVKKLTDVAYVPTIVISRLPAGGGTVYEPINLISRAWKETFLADGTTKKYQLTEDELDSDKVKVRIMNSSGTWVNKTEGTDFTVDRALGMVTFVTAPTAPTVSGMDNVEITAYKTRDGYADKINKCTFGILYGVNGASDRLFLSGNPNEPSYDWYSALYDPTYFGDLWYSAMGRGGAAVIGYSIINGCLATHKENSDDGKNVIIRQGVTNSDNEAVFPIINTLLGAGAVCTHGFGYLLNEPLFITDLGVYAITSQDLSGEKYSQNRSFYINNALCTENISDAFAIVYKDMFYIAVGGRIYILDGLQRRYAEGEPYSSFQYECYVWEGINARVLWEENGALCFGRADGGTYSFYTDKESQSSYSDEGKAIAALWELPDLSGHDFYKRKVFRGIGVRLSASIKTGVEVYAESGGVRKKLFDSGAEAVYMDFSHIDFSGVNFSSDNTPRTFYRRIHVRRVDKVCFQLENNNADEPFGIYSVALEYNDASAKKY